MENIMNMMAGRPNDGPNDDEWFRLVRDTRLSLIESAAIFKNGTACFAIVCAAVCLFVLIQGVQIWVAAIFLVMLLFDIKEYNKMFDEMHEEIRALNSLEGV